MSRERRDGTHDFDFLEGCWRIHHRRLRRPLSGSSDWYEFEGSAVERTLWEGRGNFEEIEAEMPTGLLRPALAGSGFDLDGAVRPARGSSAIRQQLIVCTIYTLGASAAATFPVEFQRVVAPVLTASGAAPVALLETEPSANDFPRLPVREGEHAFVWFARFPDAAEYDWHLETLERSREWRESVTPLLDRSLEVPAEVWRLVPAARSHTLH